MAMGALLMLAAVPATAQVKPSSLDRSFGVNGRITRTVPPEPGGSGVYAFQIANAPEGGLYVLAGQNLLRYSSNGRPNRGFGDDGDVIVGQSEDSQFKPTALAVDSQGRPLVAGTTTPTSPNGGIVGYGPSLEGGETATVLRFTPTGKPDKSFGVDGVVSSTFGFPPPHFPGALPGPVTDYSKSHCR
jgi:hypothetical protein